MVIPSTVTVSRCGANRIRWFVPGGTGQRPYTFGRPGPISSNSTLAPRLSRNSPTNRAIASSPWLALAPDGFSLGIWTRAWHKSTTLWMDEMFIGPVLEDTIQRISANLIGFELPADNPEAAEPLKYQRRLP